MDNISWLHGAISSLDGEHDCDLWKEKLRRAVIAFADACGVKVWKQGGGKATDSSEECRAALLREVGVEERDGEGE